MPSLAPLYEDVTVLTDTDATSKRLLDALDGAWLGHIAARGMFRAGSPLFSSLRMTDGPLTVYDFEQLRRAPHLLIRPSCDSGRLAPAGADELLGLTSSMLPLGTAGVGRQRRAAQRPGGHSADAEPASAPAHRDPVAGLARPHPLLRARPGRAFPAPRFLPRSGPPGFRLDGASRMAGDTGLRPENLSGRARISGDPAPSV